jgi:hypothetical protein
MSGQVTKWGTNLLLTLVVSVALGICALVVDPSYFQYPLGHGIVGVEQKENYAFPATTEIEFDAAGVDPIQIDLAAKDNDVKGEIEVFDPKGNLIITDNFDVKKLPNGIVPTPGKWFTKYSPPAGNGTYKLRLTQKAPGRISAFFYQGPFVLRFFLLPLISAVLIFIVKITFEKKAPKKLSETEE